ncbi:3,4-dihydroxybenzoate decarboxylase [Deltaproteobacteria bacterium Smac51]|nr:3,4-dihydroxybenzoate decarboxylase [Deltaproteobacteria bacterium Smac51]
MQKHDLRSAIDSLKTFSDELIETDEEVSLDGELTGVYRYIGAWGTVQRPTRLGPAMIFNRIKGHPEARVLIGLLSSRQRIGRLLGIAPEKLGWALRDSVNNPIPPITVESDKALCQEVVHHATDPSFDLRKLVPTPVSTARDAGPYITLGMCYASHPETGVSDITIHRICIQGRDELSIFFSPGIRHIAAMATRANELGRPLPVSISIGVDPAIEIATCFEPPTTPFGYDELSIAGALRGQPVEMVKCLTVGERAIAHAEYVIEGEIMPGTLVQEDQNNNSGCSLPEFSGYTGLAYSACRLIKVKAVTHRKNPIMQTCMSPSDEYVSMVGIPNEACIIDMVERAMPGRLLNAYSSSSGGGEFMAVLQFKKSRDTDEGRQRQAALLAFAANAELKHVFLVDEDVDIFDANDVLWAMSTRYQGNVDTIFIPGVRCHPLDPSQSPEYSYMGYDRGVTCKTIFDCTVPFRLKEQFARSEFMEIDPRRFAPGLFPDEGKK